MLFPGALQSGMLPDSTGISINEANTSLQQAMEEVERQSGYIFQYGNRLFKSKKKVSVSLKNAMLKKALNTCLQDQPINYTIANRRVILNSAEMNEDWILSPVVLMLLYYTDRSFKISKAARKWKRKVKRKIRRRMKKWLKDL